ncbi:MAG: glycosyltransferase [Candidatus Omnitrophica bacterium]|nr:glycosyltransferase [Candidatus Omnitrophota bacterium]
MRISRLSGDAPPTPSAYLLDRMGVLADFYRIADAVFIGGSFVPIGGHNLVEPAYFGKPVLFGPWMSNFREMVQAFKEAGAGVEVSGKETLKNELLKLMRDPERRHRMGEAARGLVAFHQGATLKNRDWVLSVLARETKGVSS